VLTVAYISAEVLWIFPEVREMDGTMLAFIVTMLRLRWLFENWYDS